MILLKCQERLFYFLIWKLFTLLPLRPKPMNYISYTLREECWLNCGNFKLYVDYTKTMNVIKGS